MKCPKCGYLGFETTERCRHCGYDFSLSVPVDASSELPLRPANEPEAPLADFDLDRIIGDAEPRRVRSATAVATPPPGGVHHQYRADTPAEGLPLFTGPSELDEAPLIATPPPARPPLAVRRATPEVARRRTPRTLRREFEGLDLQLEPSMPAIAGETAAPPRASHEVVAAAPKVRRIFAALVDVILLGGINVAVLYLTLAIAGLSLLDVRILPPIPMGAFLLLLNGGYLVVFTAANGQTIGKMLCGVRVIGDERGRVDIAGAVLRAAGVMLTLVTLGLPYLPVLLSRDGRALHDRLAGTRVIKHA
jgi:uncharacterized RDD family membrane protein YckC